MSYDISSPKEIIQEKTILSFNEPYKGDYYETVKYYVKIIFITTYKNEEYKKDKVHLGLLFLNFSFYILKLFKNYIKKILFIRIEPRVLYHFIIY